MQSLQDSIETSVSIGLFKNFNTSFRYHITHTSIVRIPISEFKKGKIDNFNPDRLCGKAYPIHDRPRGKKDLSSVRYHRKMIKNGKGSNIWVAKKKGKLILLDGAHRVIAYALEKKRTIPAYQITI